MKAGRETFWSSPLQEGVLTRILVKKTFSKATAGGWCHRVTYDDLAMLDQLKEVVS